MAVESGPAEPMATDTPSDPLGAFRELVQSLSDKLHTRVAEMMATMEDKMEALASLPPNSSSLALRWTYVSVLTRRQ